MSISKGIEFKELFQQFNGQLETIFGYPSEMLQGMNLYQLTFDCCTAYPESSSEDLLNGIIKFLTQHTKQIKENLLTESDIVESYSRQWIHYKEAAIYASNGCDYLNRQLKQKSNMYSICPKNQLLQMTIKSHAHIVWQTEVLLSLKKDCKNIFLVSLMEQIKQIRNGEEPSKINIRICIDSFLDLNEHYPEPLTLYREELEAMYILETSKYYRSESKDKISSLSISKFIEYVF
jgi:hypothetical protein